VPFSLKAGLSFAILSTSIFEGLSSTLMLSSPFLDFTITGVISSSNHPLSIA